MPFLGVTTKHGPKSWLAKEKLSRGRLPRPSSGMW